MTLLQSAKKKLNSPESNLTVCVCDSVLLKERLLLVLKAFKKHLFIIIIRE